MISAMIAVVILAAILAASELLWKKVRLHPEFARKIVHISCGTFIAFLPFWVSYHWIMVLCVAFVIVNIINRYTSIFNAIKAVRRKSWGDVLFGVGVFLVAIFQPNPWFFAIAVLQVALADGVAALVGVTYGKKRGKYYLFTQPKSLAGSAAFLAVSALVFIVGMFASSYFVDPIQLWPALIMIPLLLVCLENLAVFGLDNLVLPLTTLFILSLF